MSDEKTIEHFQQEAKEEQFRRWFELNKARLNNEYHAELMSKLTSLSDFARKQFAKAVAVAGVTPEPTSEQTEEETNEKD